MEPDLRNSTNPMTTSEPVAYAASGLPGQVQAVDIRVKTHTVVCVLIHKYLVTCGTLPSPL